MNSRQRITKDALERQFGLYTAAESEWAEPVRLCSAPRENSFTLIEGDKIRSVSRAEFLFSFMEEMDKRYKKKYN